jgi:hypothetical protein
MRVGTHHPQSMKMNFLTPQLSKPGQNFLKQDKSSPEAILKNHNKSHKKS